MMKGKVAIIGYGEVPMSRGKIEKGEPRLTGEEYTAAVADLALKDAGLQKKDFDGQGLGVSGMVWPHASLWSAEATQNLGISPKIIIRADHGGACGAELLAQAAFAISSGAVDMFLCASGDSPLLAPPADSLRPWRYENDYWLPFGMMGPNSIFAFIMRRHMHEHGTDFSHTGKIAITQRQHACLNRNAYLKRPLTMEEYLASKMIADPIRLLDCCLPVNGGGAFIVASLEKAKSLGIDPVYVLGIGQRNNYVKGMRNRPDMTYTGISEASKDAFDMANVRPADISLFNPYDDYSIAVLMQIEDAGFCKKGEIGKFLQEHDLSYNGDFPINTHGGQLSAGQPGIAGGYGHIIEAVRQLRGEAEQRQVKNAKIAMCTGIGGLAYGVNLVHTSALILGTEV